MIRLLASASALGLLWSCLELSGATLELSGTVCICPEAPRHLKISQENDTESATGSEKDVFECLEYNEHTSKKPTRKKCDRPPVIGDMRPACIAVWANDTTKGVTVKMLSCHMAQDKPPRFPTDCSENECVATRPKVLGEHVSYVCCCHKSNCNSEFRFVPPEMPRLTTLTTREYRTVEPVRQSGCNELANSLIYAVLPLCLVALLIAVSYCMYRQFRPRRRKIVENHAGSGTQYVARKTRTHDQAVHQLPMECANCLTGHEKAELLVLGKADNRYMSRHLIVRWLPISVATHISPNVLGFEHLGPAKGDFCDLK